MKIIRINQNLHFGYIEDEDLENEELKSKEEVESLKDNIARVSQDVYDQWDEEDVDTYANGGICHLIADAICDLLWEKDIECTSVSSNFEQHVYVIAKLKEGIFSIDIPHSIYEIGGGFNWKKIPNVEFSRDSVSIYCVDSDSSSWDEYIDY